MPSNILPGQTIQIFFKARKE